VQKLEIRPGFEKKEKMIEIVKNENPVRIAKFGGTSLADAEQFKKVANIIRAEDSRRYVIPSAPGKRFADDIKVTDLLYTCYDTAISGGDITELFEKIANRYRDIIADLGLDMSLEAEFDGIKYAFMHKIGRDFAASRGEYLNGKILAEYLGYDFIDAAEVIFFFDDGKFDSERTNSVLQKVLAQHERAVIPGFYGSMPNDTIKTFSRGGSDITGSIVARAVQADIYENWTDVPGVLCTDPRMIPNAKPIDVITYRELRELSYMGASVLHEDSIFPVRFAGIPINIKDTNNPEKKGTMIVSNADDDQSDTVVTGIAGKKGFSVITVEKDMMNAELGFGRRVLEVLEKEGVSFEHLPSGIDTMGVIVATSAIEPVRERIMNQLCIAVDPESISIEDGLALIAVVGRGMVKAKGTAARIFKAIYEADINIRMIDQGSCELNIIIAVEEGDFKAAVEAIYKEFYGWID